MWRRRPEPAPDRETVGGIILELMDIDAKLGRVLIALEVDDEAEEDDA